MFNPRELRTFCEAAVTRAAEHDRPVLASWQPDLEMEEDPVALWDRFRTRTDRCFFWASPWSGRQLVAAGSMLDVTGFGPSRFDQVHRAWTELARECLTTGQVSPPLVGGFAFRPAAGGERPGALPEALLWLPTLHVVRDAADASARVALNAIARPGSDPVAMANELSAFGARLLAPSTTQRGPARPNGQPNAHIREFPSGQTWRNLVTSAINEIRQGAFEKVVLARRVAVQADHSFELGRTLRHLIASCPDTTVFATHIYGRCFLGATPEYLVQVTAGTVRALALAGSAPRGGSLAEDAELERHLLSSAKDNHEHEVVTRSLAQVLSDHCVDVRLEAGSKILKLSHVQHLSTRLSARLVGSGLLQLVAALHPTPALGGHPREEALRWLDANEPLDRGWYAAPVGWVDMEGEGEFAVGIRSALVSGGTALLYAGCGVVADSDPAAEYRETQIKLQSMLVALGLD